jgi:hypothetical protein
LGHPFHTLINLDEWSDSELAPTPEGVPAGMYLVLSGDPLVPEYKVVETEKEAKRSLLAGRSWGYIPIVISRTMIPPAS